MEMRLSSVVVKPHQSSHQRIGKENQDRPWRDDRAKGRPLRRPVSEPRRRNGQDSTSFRKPGGGVMRHRKHGAIVRGRAAGYKISAAASESSRCNARSSDGFTKLIVRNIDYELTNSDLIELFSQFYTFEDASLNCDRSGRSLGSAYVTFRSRDDAIRAMNEYSGTKPSGFYRNLRIHLATSEEPRSVAPRPERRNPPARGRSPVENYRQRPSKLRRAGSCDSSYSSSSSGSLVKSKVVKVNRPSRDEATASSPESMLTSEQLDAELDDYFASVVSLELA